MEAIMPDSESGDTDNGPHYCLSQAGCGGEFARHMSYTHTEDTNYHNGEKEYDNIGR